MLWYVFNGFYLILWSALLVHCLHRREFYPIIGRKWGTKIFWLLTFIFFNPLLSLIYIIFAVVLQPRKIGENSKTLSVGSVVAVTCTILVLVLFEVPLGESKVPPVVILSRNDQEAPAEKSDSSFQFRPQLGLIRANNKVQTYSSASTETDAKVSLRNIMLICNNSHHLLDRVAREFQKLLIQLPYVDKVSYYSCQIPPESGQLLPDVFIILDMPDFNEQEMFHGRKLKAKIEWQASTSMFRGLTHSFESSLGPVVQFNIESELNHVSQMIGIESPQAKYKLEANNISNELIKSIRKQFENLLDKYGEMPELSDTLYGTYETPPSFSFITDDNIRHQISGYGLLRDNDTIWQFSEGRRTEEALAAYYDELKSLGWTEDDRDTNFLKMRKGRECIYVSRQQRRDMDGGFVVSVDLKKPTSETPMIARYESCWTEEQMRQVMDQLLDSNVGIETLLVFHQYFRTDSQRERLLDLMGKSPTHSLDGYLVQANCLADLGQTEKGREALMHARAMQYAEKGNNVRMKEIENLARKLGDESLAEVTVSEKELRQTGFLNAEDVHELMIVERGLNEPLLFYRNLEDGELQTVALWVVRSREPLSPMPYRLLTVEKLQGSSSSSEKDGNLEPNGSWGTETYLYSLTNEGISMHLKIESFCKERFRFVITTEMI
jgi:hypothetical protein